MAAERAEAAMEQVSPYIANAEYARLLEQANQRAVAWAENRIGNLITEVSATTRDVVNELSAAALENGWTNDELADELSDAFGFSDDRAEMIARTETAFAETAGTLEGYAASGVVAGKEWSADPDACDECLALDGVVVALDEDFPDDGGDGPPLHPRCVCSVAPVITAEAEELIVEE
jgi:SPP1 gp7 family putative phage head morphogenesis protein